MFRDINEAQDVLTDAEKRKLYDSGAMHADSEDFSGFSQGNMGGFSNKSGFPMGGMGGNGQNFTFKMNGKDMGGMGNIDPSQIFSMFMGGNMGGNGGFEGFESFGGKGGRCKSNFKPSKGSK